eukprot:jgi/Psemu1/202108/e_gw1.290.11.1
MKDCDESNHRDGGCTGDDEQPEDGVVGEQQPPRPVWLRPDCLDLYHAELLRVGGGSSAPAGTRQQKRQTPVTRVRDRVGLLRLGIGRAVAVQKRFPDALFLEFGVHEGKDLVRMATFLRSVEAKKTNNNSKNNNNNNNNNKRLPHCSNSSNPPRGTTFHGFDSFEGLPEDWINGQVGTDELPLHKKGAFDTGGTSPDIETVRTGLVLGNHGQPEPNINNQTTTTTGTTNLHTGTEPAKSSSLPIQFHKGWFHETLPLFLEGTKNEPVAFVHADADLYSSTLTFLKLLCKHKRFRRGSVIVFDEYWNYPNWQQGEIRAWLETAGDYGLEWEYFGYHAPSETVKKHKDYGYQSVGVVITRDMGD